MLTNLFVSDPCDGYVVLRSVGLSDLALVFASHMRFYRLRLTSTITSPTNLLCGTDQPPICHLAASAGPALPPSPTSYTPKGPHREGSLVDR